MIKCILFDRDGTLGELVDKRYPQTLLPYRDIKSVFTEIKQKGYFVGIITNQSSIARGTAGNYDFDGEFTSYGADIWEICPHDTCDNCDCRKPKSGLLTTVCSRLNITANECLVVGDRLSDIECAKRVGAEGILVLTGFGKDEKEKTLLTYPEVQVIDCFDEILNLI